MKCQQTAKSQLTRENIYIANATAAFRTVTYTYDAWGNCTATVESGNPSLENSIVNTYNPSDTADTTTIMRPGGIHNLSFKDFIYYNGNIWSFWAVGIRESK